MILRYTIFYVPDVAATLDFYKRAFGIETGFLHESGAYGELSTGTTKLAFSSLALMNELGKTPGRPDPAAPVFEIAFETDDVEAALRRAEQAGAKITQPAKDEAWGQTTGYVIDLNGYTVEICTPVGAVASPG